jgi:hypothetical protein
LPVWNFTSGGLNSFSPPHYPLFERFATVFFLGGNEVRKVRRQTYAIELQPVKTANGWEYPPRIPHSKQYPVSHCPVDVSEQLGQRLAMIHLRQDDEDKLEDLAIQANRAFGSVRFDNGYDIRGCWRGKQLVKGPGYRKVFGAICFLMEHDGDQVLVFGPWVEFKRVAMSAAL